MDKYTWWDERKDELRELTSTSTGRFGVWFFGILGLIGLIGLALLAPYIF